MGVETVLTVTDAAVEKAVLVRAREAEPERFALWVEVAGVQAGEYAYDLSLQPLSDAPREGRTRLGLLLRDHAACGRRQLCLHGARPLRAQLEHDQQAIG